MACSFFPFSSYPRLSFVCITGLPSASKSGCPFLSRCCLTGGLNISLPSGSCRCLPSSSSIGVGGNSTSVVGPVYTCFPFLLFSTDAVDCDGVGDDGPFLSSLSSLASIDRADCGVEEDAGCVSCAPTRAIDVSTKAKPSKPESDPVLVRLIGSILRLRQLRADSLNARRWSLEFLSRGYP